MSKRRPLSEKEEKRVSHILKYITEDDNVTDYELSFIISIEQQFKKDKMLSDLQLDKLEEIYVNIQGR